MVDIPEEYDFDLLKLITDFDYEEYEQNVLNENQKDPQEVVDVEPKQRNFSVPVTTTTTTTNTQINIARPQPKPKLPGFYNCSIGTINFNVIQK